MITIKDRLLARGDSIKHTFQQRMTGCTMCPPAQRMAYVAAWLSTEEPDGYGWHSLPVLALWGCIGEDYSKSYQESSHRPSLPNTVEEINGRGWGFEGQVTEFSAIVLDEEYGLIRTDDALMCDKDMSSSIIVLPGELGKADQKLVDAEGRRLGKVLLERDRARKKHRAESSAEHNAKTKK